MIHEEQVVEFVALKEHRTRVLVLDAFKFKPNGRASWFQTLAWKFLRQTDALEEAYDINLSYVRHRIDTADFIKKILRQNASLAETFNKKGTRILIGSEDYAELMSSPDLSAEMFEFSGKVRFGTDGTPIIMGLKVEVIPWMRGILVMP